VFQQQLQEALAAVVTSLDGLQVSLVPYQYCISQHVFDFSFEPLVCRLCMVWWQGQQALAAVVTSLDGRQVRHRLQQLVDFNLMFA
jgi:hypothetical protein